MSIFENATRQKLRFLTTQGTLSVEDLWDLPLKRTAKSQGADLDSIAIDLHRHLQDTSVSFVDSPAIANTTNQLRFDIVKHIIDVKKAERAAAEQARDRADRKQKLLEVLARKQEAGLEQKSEEEIRAMINELA